MDGTGQQLLAGTAFAGNQHAGVAYRHRRSDIENLVHPRRIADDPGKIVATFEFLMQIAILGQQPLTQVGGEMAARGARAGAARVLVSGPSKAADYTVVLGANDAGLLPEHRIISNASCTTNALAPLVALLEAEWGVVTGSMTTIHCYTGSQPTVDAPASDFARSRAAAVSMVPTTTSAQRLLDHVLPGLAGRIDGSAVRVPVASVSAVDLAVMTRLPALVADVNAAFRAASLAAGGVIGATDKALVSTDLRARRESIVMACPETRVTQGGMLRVFGWYDNEWGFSNRMLDMAMRLKGMV